jgi:hypothetical protein
MMHRICIDSYRSLRFGEAAVARGTARFRGVLADF